MSAIDKRIKWAKKDYFKSALAVMLNTGAILVLMALALLVKVKGVSAFIQTVLTETRFVSFIALSVLLTGLAIYLFFYHQYRDFMHKTANVFMVFGALMVSLVASYLFGFIDICLRPFALCAILTLMLTDKRTAVFMNVIYAILMVLVDVLTGLAVSELLFSFIVSFISGIIAVFLIDGEGSRLKVLLMGLIMSLPVILCTAIANFSLNFMDMLYPLLYALGSGIVSTALMMIILPVFEVFFGALTNFRLYELTDHKSKLIRELSERAQGTYHHTLTVAMLAEACGNAIGENPLLMRACAYYHDMGKLKKPEYFTENQQGRNPHDDISPELSTDIIRAHAKDGADLIRKRRLPEVLAQAAEQHHGTLPIRFFYIKASKFTDGKLSLDNFSYYGPKPQTKAIAIIMICDACEAKVRTLNNRTHENVDKAVKEIIEERMDMEQFTECDITLRELDVIRNTLTNTLSGVYHERVKYPKLKTGGKRGA